MSRSYLVKRLAGSSSTNNLMLSGKKANSRKRAKAPPLIQEYKNLNTYLNQYQGRMKAGGNSVQFMRALRQCETPKIDYISYGLTKSSPQRLTIEAELRGRKGLRKRTNQLREKVQNAIRHDTDEWKKEVQKVVNKAERNQYFTERKNKIMPSRSYQDFPRNSQNCYSSFTNENSKNSDSIKSTKGNSHNSSKRSLKIDKHLPKVYDTESFLTPSQHTKKQFKICHSERSIKTKEKANKKPLNLKLQNLKFSIMRKCERENSRNTSLKNLLEKISSNNSSLYQALQVNSSRVQEELTNSRIEQRYEGFNPENSRSRLGKVIPRNSKSYREIP
ncbi:unnamed protein product [Moneuplotes crassus]|uniref:Uncharacterized protein n=1 Tax=Euplotes crassus TaxID=5936 RepID=A0AAD1UFR0_EUPCR|nr:unnamed protein product [Moneuplotes crassus]